MPKLLTPDHLASLLQPGMRVFVQSSSSEPTAVVEMLHNVSDAASEVDFIACQIPGLNRVDFAGVHPKACFTGLFVTPETAKSYERGQMRFMPLAYSGMYRYLQSQPVDIAIIQVVPARKRGTFSLGSSVHFVPAVLPQARTVIAEINDRLPSVGRSVAIDESRLDYVLPTSHALPALDPEKPSNVARRIGAHVAELVRDGDHVQIGIGKVPNAVLEALTSHRGLICHGGLISDGMIALQEAGALDPTCPLVCTSVIGTERVYDWVRDRDDIHLHPVGYTHDVLTLVGLNNLAAINSVLAVDLSGQANAETVGGRQVGGCGGLPDFIRGARLSSHGRSILALPSTAARGTVSRIVPALVDEVVSCSRTDADYVVTEHGAAALRHRSIEERAEALIEIADPAFREELWESWERDRRDRSA